jgi:hypothetical protein
MEFAIVAAIASVLILSLLYKILPYRALGTKKPAIALLPKYKHLLEHEISRQQLEKELANYGFRKTDEEGNRAKFTRGSVLGDFSINLAKVNVGVIEHAQNRHELTVEAGWMVAFDTGDHWKFLTELCDKLRKL